MPYINLGKVKGDKGVSMRNRGSWNPKAQYVNDDSYIDVVSHNGGLWTCTMTNTGAEPTEGSAQWSLSAASIDTIHFNTAASRTNIQSGESASTTFGKIAKWFADLKTAAFQNVANNLTTTSSGSVLDARQGRVLKNSIDGITANKLKTLSSVAAVTAEGHLVDALAIKELNADKLSTPVLLETASVSQGTYLTVTGVKRMLIIEVCNASEGSRASEVFVRNVNATRHITIGWSSTTMLNMTLNVEWFPTTDVNEYYVEISCSRFYAEGNWASGTSQTIKVYTM